MALALDEPKDSDEQFANQGLTYLIDKDLHATVGKVTVDFMEEGWRSGFSVRSENPVSTGPSACGTSCSC